MLLNNIIILEILQNNFGERIDSEIYESIMLLDQYDFENMFECPVEMIGEYEIEDMNVDSYSVEPGKTSNEISGILSVLVALKGYVIFENKPEFLEDTEAELIYSFSFSSFGRKYTNFDIFEL